MFQVHGAVSGAAHRTLALLLLVSVFSVPTQAATADPPRTIPRFEELYPESESNFGNIIRAIKIGKIRNQYAHRPKFTLSNVSYFVDFAADSEYKRFWTANRNGNHRRARAIFRNYVNRWR